MWRAWAAADLMRNSLSARVATCLHRGMVTQVTRTCQCWCKQCGGLGLSRAELFCGAIGVHICAAARSSRAHHKGCVLSSPVAGGMKSCHFTPAWWPVCPSWGWLPCCLAVKEAGSEHILSMELQQEELTKLELSVGAAFCKWHLAAGSNFESYRDRKIWRWPSSWDHHYLRECDCELRPPLGAAWGTVGSEGTSQNSGLRLACLGCLCLMLE